MSRSGGGRTTRATVSPPSATRSPLATAVRPSRTTRWLSVTRPYASQFLRLLPEASGKSCFSRSARVDGGRSLGEVMAGQGSTRVLLDHLVVGERSVTRFVEFSGRGSAARAEDQAIVAAPFNRG